MYFYGGLLCFAESSTNSAIFDFADSTLTLHYFFLNFQQLFETLASWIYWCTLLSNKTLGIPFYAVW